MPWAKDLAAILRRIDGKGYKAYKDIQGEYNFGSSILGPPVENPLAPNR
jgi:predicted ABC-class ATPase